MDLATYLFAARIAERFVITAIILICVIALMVMFRRSVERVTFDATQKLNLSADIVMATPIFLLIALVGYAWVSFSNPIEISTSPSQTNPADAAPSGQAQVAGSAAVTLTGMVPGETRDADVSLAREEAVSYVEALNCLAAGQPDAPVRTLNAVASAKFMLLSDPVVWDADVWGAPEDFRQAALGIGGQSMTPDLKKVFFSKGSRCAD